jgi:hypothetical protein
MRYGVVMPMTKPFSVSVLLVLLVFSIGSQSMRAQKVNPEEGFVIDKNRPFVYILFDHIGPGIPANEDEPATRIWLHLKNNCRVSVEVRANGVPDGSPRDEVGVMHDVVLNRPVYGLPLFGTLPTAKPRAVAGPDERKPAPVVEQMPRGYMSDVASLVTIMPGKEILFSIPINHISKRWHVEIPFKFVLPEGTVPRDPKVSLGPTMVIEYSIWDVPPEFQPKVEKH